MPAATATATTNQQAPPKKPPKKWYDHVFMATRIIASPGLALLTAIPELQGLKKLYNIGSLVMVSAMLLSTASGIPAGLVPAFFQAGGGGLVDLGQAAVKAICLDWDGVGEQLTQFAEKNMNYLGRVAGWVAEGWEAASHNVCAFFENIAKAFTQGADVIIENVPNTPENIPGDLPPYHIDHATEMPPHAVPAPETMHTPFTVDGHDVVSSTIAPDGANNIVSARELTAQRIASEATMASLPSTAANEMLAQHTALESMAMAR